VAGNLDGFHDTPLLPFNSAGAGFYTEFGSIVPPGGQVFYVRGTAGTVLLYNDDPPGLRERLHATVQVAARSTVAGRGDKIICLPNHTENLASADSWSNMTASTSVIGVGRGANRPTFTFTAAGSTLALNDANVTIANCRFLAAGPAGSTALSVAAPFTCSAAGNAIVGNYIQVGIDADQLATAAFTTTAAATDLVIDANEVDGAAAAEMTTCFSFVGASGLRFTRNVVRGALATDTDGLLQFITTASDRVLIADNLLHANGTGNTVCIQMAGNIVNTGWIVRNFMRNMTDGNNNYIVTSGTGVDVQLQWNFGVNNANERGLEEGTASV